MVRKLAHQVKFELDQGDWVLGILARRLYNTTGTTTCTLHFPFIFAQKCSAQSVKVIPYVSLYLYVFPIIWHIPVCPCPLPLRTLTPIPWGLLLMAFAKNLAEDQHGLKPCPSSQVPAGSRGLDPGPHCSEVV